jgi:hypothetical protein
MAPGNNIAQKAQPGFSLLSEVSEISNLPAFAKSLGRL